MATSFEYGLCECLHARNVHRSAVIGAAVVRCLVQDCDCNGYRPLSIRIDLNCPRCLALRVLSELIESGYDANRRVADQLEALVRHQTLRLCAHHLTGEV